MQFLKNGEFDFQTDDWERKIGENVAHTQKRFYSLVASIAVSNEKLSQRVLILTVITVVLAGIQIMPLLITFFSWIAGM